MASQSLYRRYRPRRFGEVRGQEHVVGALRNAVRNGTEGHAYLFSGPRGTGKTSTARILAKALNCENLQGGEPCCECTPCVDMEAGRSFDLFELDAASNNGVDAIRDLIERTAVGSPGRTKVYILDEVHMLSPGASNALLKTLEEPPDHVRFVLATTDPQKVLPTIRSRTQHFEFQLLSAQELETYVRWIVADADLDVDDKAIAWVVRQGRGSARDTLSALDQVVAAGGVVTRVEPVEQLFAALAERDSGVAIVAVAEALAQGHDPRVLGKAFLDALRDTFLLSLGVEVPHLMADDVTHFGSWASRLGTPLLTRAMEAVGSALVEMRQAADPRVPLEVALVRLTATSDGSIDALVHRIEQLERALAEGGVAPARAPGAPAGGGSSSAAAPAAPAASGQHRPSGGSAEQASTSPGGGGPAMARAALAKMREEQGGAPAEPAAARKDAGARPAAPTPPPSSGRAAPPVPPTPPQRGAAPPVAPTQPATPAPAAAASPEAEVTSPTGASAPAASGAPATPAPPASEPAPSSEAAADAAPPSAPQPAGSTPAAPASGGGGLPPRAELESAFTDAVLPKLKGVAKAIFTAGQFIGVTDTAAVFALENAPTRDRAEKSRPDVEAALAAHFGGPVPLLLIDKADAPKYGGTAPPSANGSSGPGTVRRPGSSDPSADSTGDPDDAEAEDPMTIDVSELENADVAETGLDRLTRAFPGATLIEIDEETR